MTDQKWTKEQVAERFEAAVRTLRRLPPVRVRGYISSWPEIIYTKREIAMMDQKPKRWPPTSEAISNMEETCKWINLLDEIDDRKVIWLELQDFLGRKFAQNWELPDQLPIGDGQKLYSQLLTN